MSLCPLSSFFSSGPLGSAFCVQLVAHRLNRLSPHVSAASELLRLIPAAFCAVPPPHQAGNRGPPPVPVPVNLVPGALALMLEAKADPLLVVLAAQELLQARVACSRACLCRLRSVISVAP